MFLYGSVAYMLYLVLMLTATVAYVQVHSLKPHITTLLLVAVEIRHRISREP